MSRTDTDRRWPSIVTALSVLVLLGGSARAYGQGTNWTGGYIGGHVGTASGSVDTTFDPLPTVALFFALKPQTLTPEPKGAIFGGQGGFNVQSGHFVIGGQGDFSISKMDATLKVTPITQSDNSVRADGFTSAGQKTTWMLNIRPRIGAQAGQALIYGSIGLTYVKIEDSAEVDFRPSGTTDYVGSVKINKRGWHWAAGVEVAASKTVSVFGEFMSYRFQTANQTETATVDPVPALPPFQLKYTWTSQPTTVLRGGVNFRF